MVGLVLVSHNRRLAESACRLAEGMGSQKLSLAFAGGAGENHDELGTDVDDVMNAIRSVASPDGVLVLMDLGSAILSARMAKEMLAGEVDTVQLCPAPLVEGAVAAVVRMAGGGTLAEVYADAVNALDPKNADLASEAPSTTPAAPDADGETIPADALHYRFRLGDPNGMHTRPAAELVKTLSGFKVRGRLRNASADSPWINAASLNRVALANIRRGDTAEIALWGEEAVAALDALRRLVADVYRGWEVTADDSPGVDQAPPVPTAPVAPEVASPSRPTRLAPGVAWGALVTGDASVTPPAARTVTDPEAEIVRLDAALTQTRQVLTAARDRLKKERPQEAGILEAQALILDDRELLDSVHGTIRRESRDAAGTFGAAMQALAASYRALPDAYMRERAADVDGVAAQVLETLAGGGAQAAASGDIILYAREVTPAFMGRWDPGRLKGVLTGTGGSTSHVAILANAMGIPALTGYRLPEGTADGVRIAMDADRGEVAIDPPEAVAADFAQRRDAWLAAAARDLADGQGPAVTRDGVRIPVYANVGNAATSRASAKAGAEGIGLLRTEFLYLDRREPPTEDEQAALLAEALEPFRGKPVVVRTLDAGGDKVMPWLGLPQEANPFLGVRGVRLYEARPALFAAQLRAILRAGAGADLRIMVPMVATVDEVAFARAALERAHAELSERQAPHAWPVRFGIMVETPAAALRAATLAGRVDFFSIGTNDLTQYVMCAERGAAALSALGDGMHPAVLEAIRLVVAGAAEHGVEVAVCGEMAADAVAARALIGLGVGHLSMNPTAIGRQKRLIRSVERKALADKAAEALRRDGAEGTRALFA